jgi:transcriptional regulator with XRE-family HTH domain
MTDRDGDRNKVALGRRIKELRERSGLSQPKAAEAAGMSVGTLRVWERGRREPLFLALVQFARAIGCSLDELAGLTGGVASSTAPTPAAVLPAAEPEPTKAKRTKKKDG